jgi:hypothetical protein
MGQWAPGNLVRISHRRLFTFWTPFEGLWELWGPLRGFERMLGALN